MALTCWFAGAQPWARRPRRWSPVASGPITKEACVGSTKLRAGPAAR